MAEHLREKTPDCEAWTGHRQMVTTPIISAGASSFSLTLYIFIIKFPLDSLLKFSIYINLAFYWLVSFIIATPTTALFGIVAHGLFWNCGWRRPWHYVAGSFAFALLAGAIIGGLKNPIFYVIASGIIGLSGGLSFYWAVYHSPNSKK